MAAPEFTFLCRCCGEEHAGIPDLAFDAPFYYEQLSSDQRQAIAKKSDDLCTIADEDFFIRGILLIPIAGMDAEFGLGVWVSLSYANFQRYVELYDATDLAGEGPYFGWFSNRLPWYPETLSLRTNVHLQPHPQRPRIELEPTTHPLSVHQREGIDRATLERFIEASLHPDAAAG
jgi:hypothetical protein